MTMTMPKNSSASNQHVELLPGTLAGVIDWPILDQIWQAIRDSDHSRWRFFDNDTPLPGDKQPPVVANSSDLAASLNALNDYLRHAHPHDYCGLVFADSLTAPTLIRIFDPKFLTSMCNIYGNTPAPSWVISTMDAAQLASGNWLASKLPHHRFGKPLPTVPPHPQVADSLDARRMGCPLPLLHTARSLRRLAVGEILEIVSIDPGSVNDIEVLCNSAGAKLLALAEGEYGYAYYLERGRSKRLIIKN